MHRRQTIVFGTIGGVLVFLLIVCTLFWLNVVPFPFNREFSRPPEPVEYVPCPASNAKQVNLDQISVRVYNSGDVAGLASKVAETLTAAGVKVTDTTNWSGDPIESTAVIYTSKDGVASAYTLRAFIPQAKVIYDATLTGTQVDVVIGTKWDTQVDLVATPDDSAYQEAMQKIEGCVAVSEIPDEEKDKAK